MQAREPQRLPQPAGARFALQIDQKLALHALQNHRNRAGRPVFDRIFAFKPRVLRENLLKMRRELVGVEVEIDVSPLFAVETLKVVQSRREIVDHQIL